VKQLAYETQLNPDCFANPNILRRSNRWHRELQAMMPFMCALLSDLFVFSMKRAFLPPANPTATGPDKV